MKSPIISEMGLHPFVPMERELKEISKDDKKEKGGIEFSPIELPFSLHLESPVSTAIRWIRLQDGTPALIRPVRPADSSLLQRMFRRLSRETIYYRYFGYLPDVTPEFLARLTCVDQLREIGLVIEVRLDGKREIIGMANVVADADGRKAEYAILIDDTWQGQGLGSLLTDFVCEVTAERGVQALYATIMAINRRIIGLLNKKNFRVHRDGYLTYYAELYLAHGAMDL